MYCHPDEVGNAKREYVEQASFPEVAKHLWQPRWLKWAVAMTRKGGLVREGISTARGLTEDVANKLPGAPKAIFSRGHTSGHCAYVVDGVLVSGDALITGHPVSTRRGPQLLPDVFNHDHNDCVRLLATRGRLDTRCCCPATDRCGEGRSGTLPSGRSGEAVVTARRNAHEQGLEQLQNGQHRGLYFPA